MKIDISPREAASIIDALTAGVVPNSGIRSIVVGRDKEVSAIVESLKNVADGQNVMKFWIGEFGSGKSFMFHLMKAIALKMKFVVASADFNPDIRVYSNDGKSVALYRQLMNNLSIQTKPDGGALTILLEKWIGNIVTEVSSENKISPSELQLPENNYLVEVKISQIINSMTDAGGFDIGLVISRYFQGYIKGNDQLRRNALKWLQGEYVSKIEARQALGVHEIVNDQNYFDILCCLSKLFVSMGYAGFLINMDEAINLYKIPLSPMREKNYEKLLSFYNYCYQGNGKNMFINVAGTKDFLYNERRGLYSYEALRTRLMPNKYTSKSVIDFSQPVIVIEPIGMEDILILLNNLRDIFNLRHNSNLEITDEQVVMFMEELYNRPGASEFLLPRDVIRDFLNILSTLRQNPQIRFEDLIKRLPLHPAIPSEEYLEIEEI